MDCFPILTLSLGLLDCCIHRLFPILTLLLGLLYSWTVSQYLPCHWACWIVVFIDNFQYLPCHWACWIAVFIDCFPTHTCYWARLISVFVDCFPIHICHWSCWTAVFIDCLPMHTRHWACWIAIFIDFPSTYLVTGRVGLLCDTLFMDAAGENSRRFLSNQHDYGDLPPESRHLHDPLFHYASQARGRQLWLGRRQHRGRGDYTG